MSKKTRTTEPFETSSLQYVIAVAPDYASKTSPKGNEMNKLTATIVATSLAVGAIGLGNMQTTAEAQQALDWQPIWAEDGQLVLPEGYREWVYLGSPLTPNALNGGAAGFPEYHNVYVQPEAYQIYKETKVFPEEPSY